MARILVAGNINLETTARIDAFPLAYRPVAYQPFGVESRVSGVGYNVARALHTLGDAINLLSITGQDAAAQLIRAALAADGIADRWVLPRVAATPQSVVLYAADGRRQVVTDLKDVPELRYPAAEAEVALAPCDLAVLTNIAYTRPLLDLARRRGVPIATDLHTLTSLDDPYSQPWLMAATLLFMSGEQLPEPPAMWTRRIFERFPAEVVVIGLGPAGALLALRDGGITQVPAVTTRPVVSTGGAGDALLAAFLHGYLRRGDPERALRLAVVFAAHKIGVGGSSAGFLGAAALDELAARVYARADDAAEA